MPLFSVISAKLGHFFDCNEMGGQVATCPYTIPIFIPIIFPIIIPIIIMILILYAKKIGNVVLAVCFPVGTGRDLSVLDSDNNPDNISDIDFNNIPNINPDNHPNNHPDNRK